MASNRVPYVQQTTADTATAGANAAVTITCAAAGAGIRHVLHEIKGSYAGGTPTGSLTITDGGSTVFQEDIDAAGPFSRVFDPPLVGAANSALVVTLGAGGSGLIGKLNLRRRKTSQ